MVSNTRGILRRNYDEEIQHIPNTDLFRFVRFVQERERAGLLKVEEFLAWYNLDRVSECNHWEDGNDFYYHLAREAGDAFIGNPRVELRGLLMVLDKVHDPPPAGCEPPSNTAEFYYEGGDQKAFSCPSYDHLAGRTSKTPVLRDTLKGFLPSDCTLWRTDSGSWRRRKRLLGYWFRALRILNRSHEEGARHMASADLFRFVPFVDDQGSRITSTCHPTVPATALGIGTANTGMSLEVSILASRSHFRRSSHVTRARNLMICLYSSAGSLLAASQHHTLLTTTSTTAKTTLLMSTSSDVHSEGPSGPLPRFSGRHQQYVAG